MLTGMQVFERSTAPDLEDPSKVMDFSSTGRNENKTIEMSAPAKSLVLVEVWDARHHSKGRSRQDSFVSEQSTRQFQENYVNLPYIRGERYRVACAYGQEKCGSGLR